MRDLEQSVGSKFVLSKDGKPRDQFYLGFKEQPVLNVYKIAGQRFTRDDKGRITKVVFLDLEGKEILRSPDKVSSFEIKYDKNGNAIERRYFDDKGKIADSGEGFAIAKQDFDEYDNPKNLIIYDAKEKPKFQTQTSSTPLGQPLWKAYFDKDGKPIPYKGKIHKEKYKYNSHGQEIEVAFYDTNDKPTVDENGIHKIANKYDDKGNQTERSYFNTEGNLKALKDGVASIEYKYDDLGNITEKKYLGAENKPVEDTEGIAIYRYKRDKWGQAIEEAYFNKEDKPTKNSFDVFIVKNKYDDRGNIIEEQNCDEKGAPMANKSGFYTYKNMYDKAGNRISRSGYDKDGKLAANQDGIATLKIKYNEQGKPIEITCYGIDDKTLNPKTRPAIEKYIYGPTGLNWLEQAFYDKDGNPTEFKGIHKIKLVKQGGQIGYVAFDKAGKPVTQPKK